MPNINQFLNAAGRLGLASAFVVVAILAVSTLPGLEDHAFAQDAGTVPGQALGNTSDSDFWRKVREGAPGTVSIPDQQAAVMIQSEGENWRNFRNGPLSNFGVWVIVGVVVVLALFFALRGRIKIDSGFSGKVIERFNGLERIAHWLTAGSFIVLAITGLNIMYGRYVFGGAPVDGGEFGALHRFFALVTYGGKYAHDYVAFAFMLGLVMTFVLWIKDNIPSGIDLKWIAVGGGLFSKNVHPPAKKFNAGQKIIFWVVILGGLLMSLSGIALLFPFMFDLSAGLTGLEEIQFLQISHAAVAVVMIAIIIAHIYIGSLGMEGAYDAMGSGMVDENWAREHHGLWVEEVKGTSTVTSGDTPAPATDGEPQAV